MSSLGGCQQEMVTYEGLDHTRSKYNKCFCRDLSHVLNVLFIWKEKRWFFALRNFCAFHYPGMWFYYYYPISAISSVTGSLTGEVKNNYYRKIQTLSYQNSSSCFQEVPNLVIWLWNFWYCGKLVIKESWSLMRGGHYQSFSCILREPPLLSKNRSGGFL